MVAEESEKGDLRTATTGGGHDTPEVVRVQGSEDSGREGLYRSYPPVHIGSAKIRAVNDGWVFEGEERNGGI